MKYKKQISYQFFKQQPSHKRMMIDLKFNKDSQVQKECQQLNIEFYKQLFVWINVEEDVAFYDRIIKKTKQIKQQLSQLSMQEQAEWSYHISTKIRQLASSSTNHTTEQLLEKFYVLVDCSKKLNIPYSYQEIHVLIKQTYYDVYKEKIVPLFKKTGFDVQQFQILEYQDSWLTRFWRAIVQ